MDSWHFDTTAISCNVPIAQLESLRSRLYSKNPSRTTNWTVEEGWRSKYIESLRSFDCVPNASKAIKREGIENLTLEELQSACIARGMPGSSKSIYMLRQRLNEWLELSLEKKVPPTLLILSRAISINSKAAATKEMLKDTMMALPQELIDAIDLEMKERSGKVDRALKLEVLEQLRERITEEVGRKFHRRFTLRAIAY